MVRFENSTYLNLKDIGFSPPAEKKVLAFVGKRKSGKSLCAETVQKLDDRFSQKAFADILKQTYAEIKDIPLEDLYHNTNKEKYRHDLIELSWSIKRDKGVFYFAEEYFNSLVEDQLVVCDDLRIIEELQLLIMYGGVAYGVHSPDHLRVMRGWKRDPEIDNDISETELGNVGAGTLRDATGGGWIYNTQSIAYLEEQLIKPIKVHFPVKIVSKDYKSLEDIMKLDFGATQ